MAIGIRKKDKSEGMKYLKFPKLNIAERLRKARIDSESSVCSDKNRDE